MNHTQQMNGQSGAPANKPRPPAEQKRKLIVDLKAAQGRLDRSQERLKELETNSPTAFFEIKRAKDVVSAARAIVELYDAELKQFNSTVRS